MKQQYRLPIKELFEIIGLDDIPNEEVVYSDIHIGIKSPTGSYVPISGFVKKRHEIAQYEFSGGVTLECSTRHIVFNGGNAVLISETEKVDTIDGQIELTKVEYKGDGEVYDISLEYPHKYITPNGIIHHNTTVAHLLTKEIGFDPADVRIFDGSTDTGVDLIRDRIRPFVETISHNELGRVVIIEEFDRLSKNSQDALKCIMIDNMDNARFILLTNNIHRIDNAILSRCQTFQIDALDKDEYTLRVANVLVSKSIQFDLPTLEHYVEKNYPDMRGIFNDVERYTFDGVLKIKESKSEFKNREWMMTAVVLFQEQRHREARDVVCSNIRYEDYEGFYRLMYENVDWWANGDDKKRDSALIIIKDHLVDDSSVGDREIVLASCLTSLAMI